MDEPIKKLNDETRAALMACVVSKTVTDFIATTKAASAEDSGTFKTIISTADIDRQGESVNQAGWDLSFYKANPIVLWAHDYQALPIGVTTSIEVKDGKLVAEGKFAPADANPFAQQVRRLYELGMVNTTSVGFIPKEFDGQKDGVINKAELLEFSFVPVPANPYALRLDQIKKLNLDVPMLKTKNIDIQVKEDAPAPAPEPTPTPEPTPAPVEQPKVEPTPEPTPEPAKTEPVVEAPVTASAKGEVTDELAATNMRQEKYEKYCKVMDALDAFACVYFADETPVENFAGLLNETIGILTQIASGGEEMDSKAATAKMLAGRKSIRQYLNHVALGSLKLAEGDTKEDDDTPLNQRSKNSMALAEINSFIETRTLLRSIDNAVEKALRNFNQAARAFDSTAK